MDAPSLKTLRAAYKNRPVFLVGNGPSMIYTPLQEITKRRILSFGVNMVAQVFKDTLWRPKFYVCTSSVLGDDEWRSICLQGAWAAWLAFLWDEFAPAGPNIVPVRCSQVHHEDNPTASFWSDDASKRVSKYGTVMFAALQIAAYMGFNPIYLTACDLNYTSHASADPNHARPQIVPGRNFDAARNNRGHVSAHEIALQQCNRLGVDVYNASVGGALEVYPRVDFMEAVMEAQKRNADYGY